MTILAPTVPASAQTTAAVSPAQARVQWAVRRVLGGAHTSARSMLAMIKDAREILAKQLPEASALFSPELEAFAKRNDNRVALLFRNNAIRCGEVKLLADEDVSAFVGRAAKCMNDAMVSADAAAVIHRVRYLARQLGHVSTKGALALQRALPDIRKYMPPGIAETELVQADLRTFIMSATDAQARTFGIRANGCSALRTAAGESGADFTKRLGDCMAKASRAMNGKREVEEVVVGRSIDRLIAIASQGVRSLRSGLDQAVGLLDERIDHNTFYSTTLRTALSDASPLVATYFIRGARRCRRIVRSPTQSAASFTKLMGQCLTGAVEEVSPFALVPVVLGAVKTVVSAAAKGPEALRAALVEGDNQLHGKVAPSEVFGGDVRRNIAIGNAQWVAQFAKLGVVCQTREFKKHHRFDEFVIRVNLCLSSASSGLDAITLEKRIISSIRTVAASGSRGARNLQNVLNSEVRELEKVMRVADLYPDPWRASMKELLDASARVFAQTAGRCAVIPKGKDEGLGQYVKRLAACLENARMQSGGDAIARKVRESVQSLIYAAQTSSGTLRNSVGPAVALLGGFVHPDLLFTPSLREALAVASDEMATTFAREGKRCVDIQRTGSANAFAQAVSNCLQSIVRVNLDKSRQDAVRDAITQILALADGGPQQLMTGYPPLWGKIQTHLNLGGTFVQSLYFDARVKAFASYARSRCLSMPASTPVQVGAVRTCLFQAKSTADAIEPPDSCRGKTGTGLAECCLEGENRLLRSCAQHRYSCRTGESFQNGRCAAMPTGPGRATGGTGVSCPPGSTANEQGVCLSSPCPLGTFRGITGQCAPAICPPGSTLDTLGRCLQTFCPNGAVLNAFSQCQSGTCPVGTVFAGTGCVASTCPYGATKDVYGRCQNVLCPEGQTMNQFRQCVNTGLPTPLVPGVVTPGFVQPGVVTPGYVQPGVVTPGYVQPGVVTPGYVQPGVVPQTACAVGFVMGPQGYCVRNFCPPGTVLNQFGQCVAGGCPLGTVMNQLGQCVR